MDDKYIKQCFNVPEGSATDSVSMTAREVSISIRDLTNFTDSEESQINYLYEYGPPRKFDIVVEVINKAQGKTSASADGLGKYPTADLDGDSDTGTNTGWDRMTVSNTRLPTFLLRKQGDAAITKNSFSAYSSTSNAYNSTNVDINSEKAFVTYNNKFYLLLQNYAGTKAPASSAGKGYWLEVDSICVATVSRPEKSILEVTPEQVIYHERSSSQTLLDSKEEGSTEEILEDRLTDIQNGGFIVYMSNLKEVDNTSYFDRDQIWKLSNDFPTTEIIKRPVNAEEITNQDGSITQNQIDQEISVVTKKFEPDDSLEDIQRTFEIEIPEELENNPSKFFCIYAYDAFDGSVINHYGKRGNDSIEYRRRAIALSNVVDLSWGS